MKLRKLNWRTLAAAAIFAGGIFISSCNNEKQENNSTSTDGYGNRDNTQLMPSDNGNTTTPDSMTATPNTTNSTTTATTNTAKIKRKTRVSVAVVPESRTSTIATDVAGYYNYADVMPVYSGGQTAISDYITNNIEYPDEAIDNNIQGTVNIQFGIDENGNITRVKTIGSPIGYGLEEEAIRVVSDMPKWNAGTIKGKKVKTLMTIPITYRIDE